MPYYSQRVKSRPVASRLPPASTTGESRMILRCWLISSLLAACQAVGPAAAKDRATAPVPRPAPLLERVKALGIQEIVFAMRQPGKDGHWYANFGYYADSEKHLTYGNGGKLCRLNLATGAVTTLAGRPRRGASATRSSITTASRSSSPIARAERPTTTSMRSTSTAAACGS